MSQLSPCPGCSRHVKVAERVCPFCARDLPAQPVAAVTPPGRPRMSRAAAFALGATMVGAAACSSSTPKTTPDGNADAPTTDAGPEAGTGGGGAGGGGAGGASGPTDGGQDHAPIPIYSAVFPPERTRVAMAPKITHEGDRPPRSPKSR